MFRKILFSLIAIVLLNFAKATETDILDAVVIGKDTIVASTYDSRIIVSYNGGKTWKTTKKKLIKNFGLDGKRIWGIDSWIGIHEKDYSRLFYSDDFGQTWRQIELNPEKFFAIEFIQIKYDKLLIVDAFGALWKHSKTPVESEKSWKQITPFKATYTRDCIYSFSLNNYIMLSGDSLYLCDLSTGKTVREKTFNDRIRVLCLKNINTVMGIDSDGNVYEYSIPSQTSQTIGSVKGYRYFLDFIALDDKFYILGMGNDDSKDYVLFSIIDAQLKNEFIGNITGLDQDICFIDKYKRIWCGTTDGLFVLNPNQKSFQKIL